MSIVLKNLTNHLFIRPLFSEFQKSFDNEQYSKKLSERWEMKMPTAFFAQLSLSSNYSASTRSSDGWFSYSNSDIDTQDLLSSSKNNLCFWVPIDLFLRKSVKFDLHDINPIVNTMSWPIFLTSSSSFGATENRTGPF